VEKEILLRGDTRFKKRNSCKLEEIDTKSPELQARGFIAKLGANTHIVFTKNQKHKGKNC
jgi:hypothetical protein